MPVYPTVLKHRSGITKPTYVGWEFAEANSEITRAGGFCSGRTAFQCRGRAEHLNVLLLVYLRVELRIGSKPVTVSLAGAVRVAEDFLTRGRLGGLPRVLVTGQDRRSPAPCLDMAVKEDPVGL